MAKLLSPITNDRTDEYGAESVETRGRYMVEMFTALRKAVGKGFPLECVLSVDEEEFGGYTKEEMCIRDRWRSAPCRSPATK